MKCHMQSEKIPDLKKNIRKQFDDLNEFAYVWKEAGILCFFFDKYGSYLLNWD
jgi:hypothetical protein